MQILEGLKPKYEAHHQVQYTDEALKESVKLSRTYISDHFLPDMAIDVIDDDLHESSEDVVLTLTGATGGVTVEATADTASLVLADDDPLASVSFSTATSSVEDGESVSHNVDVVLELNSAVTSLPEALSLDVTIVGSIATAGADYVAWPADRKAMEFPAGSTSGAVQSVTIDVLGDTATEGNETITLGLGVSAADVATATPMSQTVTLRDVVEGAWWGKAVRPDRRRSAGAFRPGLHPRPV